MATLVVVEEKFNSAGALTEFRYESNYNTVEEALTQAKHDIATQQRKIEKVIDNDTEYSLKQIKAMI